MIDHWILALAGGAAGWSDNIRGGVAHALVTAGRPPTTMTMREEDGPHAFDEAALAEPMPGPWPGALVLRGDGVEVVLWLGEPARITASVRMSRTDATALGASLAAIVEPDLAWLRPAMAAPQPPFTTTTRALGRMLDGADHGVGLEDRGPGGLGVVTWLGPNALAHLPERALAGVIAAGAIVTELPWRGVQIALGGESLDELSRAWTAAMARLAPAGFFATSTIDDATGAVRYTPPAWWASAPLAGARPRPAIADPLAKLIASAAAGTPVIGARATGLNARGAELSRLRAEDVDLAGADLSGARLRRAVLVDVDLDRAVLDDVDLDGAQLDQTSLRRARGAHTVFAGVDLVTSFCEDAVLPDADFGGALLRLCELDRWQVPRADFEGAQLEDCRCTGALFAGARFTRTTLRRCDFTGADFSGASFVDATIEDCTFTGARLDGVTWPSGFDPAKRT